MWSHGAEARCSDGRSGGEGAFEEPGRTLPRPLIKIALMYFRQRAVAEEVAQETWLVALDGGRF